MDFIFHRLPVTGDGFEVRQSQTVHPIARFARGLFEPGRTPPTVSVFERKRADQLVTNTKHLASERID